MARLHNSCLSPFSLSLSFMLIVSLFSLKVWTQQPSQTDAREASNECQKILENGPIDIAFGDPEFLRQLIDQLEQGLSPNSPPNPMAKAYDHRGLNIAYDLFKRAFPPFQEVATTTQAVLDGHQNWTAQDYSELRARVLAQLGQHEHSSPGGSVLNAQLETLRHLQILHALTPFPEPEHEKKESPQDKNQQDKNQQEEEQGSAPPPDQLQTDPENSYNVHNKDLQGGGEASKAFYQFGTSQKPPVPHLRLATFDTWDLSGKLRRSLSVRPPQDLQAVQSAHTGWMFIENPKGLSRFVLPVGYGSVPILGAHGGLRVVATAPDEYQVRSMDGGSLPEHVVIPIAEAPDTGGLDALAQQVLRRHSGLSQSLWPTDILEMIQEIRAQQAGPLESARSLSKYIADSPNYRYCSSDKMDKSEFASINRTIEWAQSTGKPLAPALAHGKLFNCDGAALLGATLLRDFFKLPTRISTVLNIKGSKPIDGVEYWLVDANDPLHAVVEVWHLGRWHVFDFTPKHNQPEGSPSDSDQDLNPFDSNPDQSPDSTDSNSNPAEPEEESSLSESAASKEDATDSSEGEVMLSERVDQLLPQTRPKADAQNDYQDQLIQIIYIWILEQFFSEQPPSDWEKVLSPVRAALSSGPQSTRDLFSEKLHPLVEILRVNAQYKDFPVRRWIELAQQKTNSDPDAAYKLLKGAYNYLDLLAKERHLSPDESKFFADLQRILQEMHEHSSPNSAIHSFVSSVLERLPGQLIRGLLNKIHQGDVGKMGSQAQKDFFSNLQSGKLRGIIEAGHAFREIDLTSNPEFTTRWARTPLPSEQNKPRSRDINIARLTDFGRIGSWVWNPEPYPDRLQSLLTPLVEGRQLYIGNRQMVQRVNPRAHIERKLSVIFFDISGSMGGDPIRAQTASIIGFLDWALSDQDKMGNHLHEVWLYPFDGQIHLWGEGGKEPIKIRNSQEAEKLITSWLNKVPDASGGDTQIQACFDEWFRAVQVRYAEQDSYFGLDQVNMVLFSDGQSSVNEAKLRQDLATLPKSLSVAFRFVAIGTTNEGLEAIARSEALSRSNHADKETASTFQQITHGELSTIAQSGRNIVVDADAASFEPNTQFDHRFIDRLRALTPPSFFSQPERQHLFALRDQIQASTISREASSRLGNLRMLTQLLETTDWSKLPPSLGAATIYRLIEGYGELRGGLNSLNLSEKLTLVGAINRGLGE